MKKILGLSIAVLLITGLVVGGTLAYFSDTETSPGNVFTAGTIDLEVDDQNPWIETFTAELTDRKPCATEDLVVKLENVGTNPMDVWVRLNNVVFTEGLATYATYASSEPEYVAELGTFVDGVPAGDNTPVGLNQVIDITIDFGDVVDVTFDVADLETGPRVYLGVMDGTNPGPADVWNGFVTFTFPCDSGNQYQGDTMTFDIEFFAQQNEAGTEPAPGTELTGYAKPTP
jgi:predicted ribosomally synthesized peptide with SipW-like signal peptide